MARLIRFARSRARDPDVFARLRVSERVDLLAIETKSLADWMYN